MRYLNYLLYTGGWVGTIGILFWLKYALLDKLRNNSLKHIMGMTLAYAFTLLAAYVYLKHEGIDLRLAPITGMRPKVSGALALITTSYSWLLLHYKKKEEKRVPLSRKCFTITTMYLHFILTLCSMFVLRVFMFDASLDKELRILHVETDSLVGLLTISGILLTVLLGLVGALTVVWYMHNKGRKGMLDTDLPPSNNDSEY